MTISQTNQASSVVIEDQYILSHLGLALITLDHQGHVVRIDGSFDAIFQQSSRALLGKTIADLPLSQEMATIFQRLLSGQSSVLQRDIKFSPDTQHPIYIDIQGIPLVQQNCYMLSLSPKHSSVVVDEQQLDIHAASMTVSGLSAMLAHEIKNPLSGIRGAAQLLGRKVSKQQQSLPEMIVKEVDRISRIVNDLEGFSCPLNEDLKGINIHAPLDQALANIKAGIGQSMVLVTDFDPSLPPVKGGFDALVQVFLNILKNAVEASDINHKLMIKTQYQHRFWMKNNDGVTLKLPIEVTIADEGCGIEPTLKDHLFDPFVTNKEGGSGLGLAIVARNMTAMGGYIKCTDNQPKGTKIHLYFQMAE